MLVSCFFLQTLTVISSSFGETPTIMPPYTGVPGPMKSIPRSWGAIEAVGDRVSRLISDEGARVPP